MSFILFIALAFSTASAQTGDNTKISFHPYVILGSGWNAKLVLFNAGNETSTVRLSAYDTKGQFLGEIPASTPLSPGERKTYSQGSWPKGAASIQVESGDSISSLVTLESKDGTGLEHVIPSLSPTETLVFPVHQIAGERIWSRLALLNTGASSARIRVVAFDQEGRVLQTLLLPNLDPMEQVMVFPQELFGSNAYATTATLHVIGDQPLAGLQLMGSDARADVASLPATNGLGQEILLPIFQQAQGVDLWTTASLLNVGDEEVSVTAEALNADGQVLGVLTEPSFIPGRGMRNLSTSNLQGILPADVAFLKITADQPIRGLGLIGTSQSQGLTAVGALTESDGIDGYELLGTDDGRLLAVSPLLIGEADASQSALSDIDARFWKRSVSRPESSVAAAALKCSSTTTIAFGALPKTGFISAPGEVDCFTFTGAVGDTVRVRVIKRSGTFEPLAEVVRPNGQTCAAPTLADEFNCTVNPAGKHTILIRDFTPGTRTGTYQLRITK
jgi:hypothetical protein